MIGADDYNAPVHGFQAIMKKRAFFDNSKSGARCSIREQTQHTAVERLKQRFEPRHGLYDRMEWLAYLRHIPRLPMLYSAMAVVAVGVAAWQFFRGRSEVRRLQLGHDGERSVGQFLEPLREAGGLVFDKVPGQDFNLDHVVICPHGIFVIETKSWKKPWPQARITVEGDTLRVAGRTPLCDPI